MQKYFVMLKHNLQLQLPTFPGGAWDRDCITKPFHNFFTRGEIMKNANRTWLILATWGAVLTIGGCGGKAVVPNSYSTFTDSLNNFTIQYPDGWSCDSGGQKNYAWARFGSGSTLIEVESDLANATVLTELAVTGAMPVGGSGFGDPSQDAIKVHRLEKKKLEAERGFKEEKAERVNTALGDGWQSEFTAAGSFGSEMRGIRATTVNKDKRIRIICQCPKDEWEKLKPVFDKVIASVSK
jgi:hypothetical protein